jgi:hypothetical protein
MAATKTKPAADETLTRLADGHYDRVLAEFEARIEEAAATLRRAYEAMKAENTLRS